MPGHHFLSYSSLDAYNKEYHHPDDILRCTSVDFQIPLREIYQKVEFDGK
jgi:hypothetical protein